MGWYTNIPGTNHHHDPDDDNFDADVSGWAHPPPKKRGEVMTETGEENRPRAPVMERMQERRKIEPIK